MAITGLNINNAEKITMTHTGLIAGKNGKFIHVCFERDDDKKKSYAEIVLPGRKVLKNDGFEEGEIAQLQVFLKDKEKEIVNRAKQINHDLIFNL